jgi:hypothetical protein
MQLLTVPPEARKLVVTIDPKALELRQTLLDVAVGIGKVSSPEENEMASQWGSAAQKLIKDARAAGLALRRPINADAHTLKKCEDGFLAPLLPHLDRISRLCAVHRVEEERKAELERQARAAEIARLQEQQRKAAEDARKAAEVGDLAGAVTADLIANAASVATLAAVAAPEPEAGKTAGQSFRPDEFDFEVTDINVLWAARPDLCVPPTAKRSAIKSCCGLTSNIPGLRFFPAPKVSFTSR